MHSLLDPTPRPVLAALLVFARRRSNGCLRVDAGPSSGSRLRGSPAACLPRLLQEWVSWTLTT
jgi:hypothetical protein